LIFLIFAFFFFWAEQDNSEKKEIKIRSSRNGDGIKAGSENIPSAAGRGPEEISCSTSAQRKKEKKG
jgi:hypothetical protein